MGVAVHIFNVRAQQNREMWMLRQVAPHLRDDRPIVLEHDRQARAREQFGRLFSPRTCSLQITNSEASNE